MKKIGEIGLLVLALFVVSGVFCGCGNSADKSFTKKESAAYNVLEDSAGSLTASENKSTSSTETSVQVTQNRKMIEYVYLTVETKNFDQLMDDIDNRVKESGGYIENSQIGGNRYYTTDNRTATLKIRIPKTKQSDFSDFMSKKCNIVNRSVNTEDVTDRYIDTQSRIKALTLEKETLEKLLTASSNVSETLTVYERLTNVIAEIESYQGKLNQMDNLIDYTTFTVDIDEVEKETKVEQQNWFARTWNDLSDNFSDVGNGLLNFLSFLIAALPYWILLGIVVVIIILIIRSRKKKR